jgi:hypothetical protein
MNVRNEKTRRKIEDPKKNTTMAKRQHRTVDKTLQSTKTKMQELKREEYRRKDSRKTSQKQLGRAIITTRAKKKKRHSGIRCGKSKNKSKR